MRIFVILLLMFKFSFLNSFYAIPSLSKPYKSIPLRCIMKNENSYYNQNVIVNNQTSDIATIYTTYNHKYSLIVYINGSVEEYFNKSLKLKCTQDIIQLNIVSNTYFERICREIQK